MQSSKMFLGAGAALALALFGPQGATAQSGSAPDKATADYKTALETALGTGYWTGRFEGYDAAGKLVEADETPSCIAPGDPGGFASTIMSALDAFRSVGNCTSSGGGAQSLSYRLSCTASSGVTYQYDSSGSFKPGASVELHITMGITGKTETMHLNMTRVSATCPK